MIISEIGHNHLGNLKLLNNYVNRLSKKKIDGITLQILKKADLQKNKIEGFDLNYNDIDQFILSVSSKNKKVGLALGNENVIDNLKYIKKISFFKVLSKDFKNSKLIDKLLNIKNSKIYVAIGFAKTKEINFFVNKYSIFKNRIVLVYTDFDHKMKFIKLINIELLRKKFNIDIAFGNHSHNKKMIYYSKIFNPESIFFYVKGDNNNLKTKYPDDLHAIKISELNYYLKKIKNMPKI